MTDSIMDKGFRKSIANRNIKTVGTTFYVKYILGTSWRL